MNGKLEMKYRFLVGVGECVEIFPLHLFFAILEDLDGQKSHHKRTL